MDEMFQMSCGSLAEEFSDLGIEVDDQDVLDQLAVLCQRYNIDNGKMSCEYFSFNTKSKLMVGQPPTMELLNTFENEKLKSLKSSGVRRPLDPIEGAENLPDCPEIGGGGTPVRLVTAKRGAGGIVTPDGHLAKRFVTAVGSPVVSLLHIPDQWGAPHVDIAHRPSPCGTATPFSRS